MTAKIFTWDWKGEINMEAIAAAVKEISQGQVFMQEMDTGGDMYAWIIADHQVGDEEAWDLYRDGRSI